MNEYIRLLRGEKTLAAYIYSSILKNNFVVLILVYLHFIVLFTPPHLFGSFSYFADADS